MTKVILRIKNKDNVEFVSEFNKVHETIENHLAENKISHDDVLGADCEEVAQYGN